MDLETRRQFVHMSGVGVALYVKWVNDAYGYLLTLASLILAFLAGLALTTAYKKGIKIPLLVQLIDLTERPEVIRDAPGKGALSFFLGSLLALIFFGFDVGIASASIAVLALGDSASTLVGRNFGWHKIQYNRSKSWEGTLGGLVLATVGASLLLWPELALVGAIGGMFIESLPLKTDDNITVPLGAGTAMSLALYFQS